jgi:hypothetical protein
MLEPIAFLPKEKSEDREFLCYCHITGPGAGPPPSPCRCIILGPGIGA